jgi:hypothetical protein
LRRPLSSHGEGTIRHPHRSFQPAFHIQQDPFLIRVAADRIQCQIPADRVEELRHIKVHDPVLLPAPLPADLDRVQRRPARTIPVGVRVEDLLHLGLHASTATVCATLSTTLGMPRTLIPPFLGISTARTGPGKYEPDDMRFHSLKRLFFNLSAAPRIPHQPFRNVMRLAFQQWLTHATPPFRLITLIHLDDPTPWLHPHCDTQRLHSYYRRVRRRAPQHVLSSSRVRRLEVSISPPTRRRQFRGHAFTCSIREPGPDSCCLYAGPHLSSKRVTPRLIPGFFGDPGFGCHLMSFRRFRRQRAHTHRSSSRSTSDAVTATPFPTPFNTTVFS